MKNQDFLFPGPPSSPFSEAGVLGVLLQGFQLAVNNMGFRFQVSG